MFSFEMLSKYKTVNGFIVLVPQLQISLIVMIINMQTNALSLGVFIIMNKLLYSIATIP
jgi:hypothetical protein